MISLLHVTRKRLFGFGSTVFKMAARSPTLSFYNLTESSNIFLKTEHRFTFDHTAQFDSLNLNALGWIETVLDIVSVSGRITNIFNRPTTA